MGQFRSNWRESFKLLDEIYAKSPDAAYAQMDYMLNQLNELMLFIKASEMEEARMARAAEQQAQKAAVILWVQEQESHTYDVD